MSSPLVWIFLPAFCAVLLFVVRRWQRAVAVAGAVITLALAWLGWFLPIGERLRLSFISIELNDTLTVLGRRFVLEANDKPVIMLLYLAAAFWFAGSLIARVDQQFIPLGLGIAALLIAAIAVEPFLYAALLIEMAVLLCVPLLTSFGRAPGRGIVRFLTFQTLGMPFLLFSGWAIAGVEATPGDPGLIFRASVLLGLGFAFLLVPDDLG
jgi:NADH-quinone oxidoreductase subunit N